MKADEYRAMAPEQLDLTYKETVKQLFHLRVQSATERLETPSEMNKVKKDIARILTVRRERELAAAKQQQPAQAAGQQGA
jgi:large subunit ribosomal protein L29